MSGCAQTNVAGHTQQASGAAVAAGWRALEGGPSAPVLAPGQREPRAWAGAYGAPWFSSGFGWQLKLRLSPGQNCRGGNGCRETVSGRHVSVQRGQRGNTLLGERAAAHATRADRLLRS
jgi:hypothetical protein